MSKLESLVTEGPQPGALRVVGYGPEGVGKTTLAGMFPDPIFLDAEDSSSDYNLRRIMIPDLAALNTAIDLLLSEPHPYKTVVLDTISKIQIYYEAEVCKEKGKKNFADFSWGDGHVLVREKFDLLLYKLDELVRRGIHVVLLGHSTIKRFNPPELSEGYDRYQIGVGEQAAASMRRWANCVLFITYKTLVTTNDQKQTRGIGGKKRVILTTRAAAYDAKNRIGLPDEIAFDDPLVLPEALAALFELRATGTGEYRARLMERVAEITKNIDPAVLKAFTIHRGQLKPEQDISEVPTDWLERITKFADGFKKAVEDFAKENQQPAETK